MSGGLFYFLFLLMPHLSLAWTCQTSTAMLVVTEDPFSYQVSSLPGDSNGDFLLERGGLAIHQDGVWYSQDTLTPLPGWPNATAFTIQWSTPGDLLVFNSTFSCSFSSGLISFELIFPQGATGMATLPLPPHDASLHPNALPSTHFPSFAADSSTALGSHLGYLEYAGIFSSADSSVGKGLAGFKGGQQSGPLVLFTEPNGTVAVLSPLTGFQSSIIAAVPAPASKQTPGSSCEPLPNTDQTGASHSPGTDAGIRVSDAAACCALCMSLGLSNCTAWVFDTPSPPTGPNCWPTIGITGTTTTPYRELGLVAPLPLRVLSGGVQGYVTDLPPGFTVSFGLWVSNHGITDAMLGYGRDLLTHHSTRRLPKTSDPLSQRLSYWSDNGGYYYDAWILALVFQCHQHARVHFPPAQRLPCKSRSVGGVVPAGPLVERWPG